MCGDSYNPLGDTYYRFYGCVLLSHFEAFSGDGCVSYLVTVDFTVLLLSIATMKEYRVKFRLNESVALIRI